MKTLTKIIALRLTRRIRRRLLFLAVVIALIFIPIETTHASSKVLKFSVTYNANGGKHAPKNQYKRSSKRSVIIRLSKKKPVRTGYLFKTWNTKKKGTGKSYQPGSKITIKRSHRAVKLYAIWKPKKAKTAAVQTSTVKEPVKSTPVTVVKDQLHMEVHFIDVGQGDATLIICDGEAMLIDAGPNDKGTALQSYLMSKGIKSLKYVIGTHPHEDHIGGLDVVITKFDVKNLFMPNIASDTRTYDDVIQAAKYKSLKITNPIPGTTYQLGTATFQIVSAGKTYTDNVNNDSICIRLVHGNNSFLFVGDAEEEEEMDMLATGYTLKSDVYKAAHHGSKTGSVEAFMNVVQPKYTIISCGQNNTYGHPHAAVLNLLRQMNSKTFRTDEQGTIMCVSDGKTLTWSASPSTSWIAGEATGSSGLSEQTKSYVLNTNSRVFHLPTCSSVSSMSLKNRQDVNIERDKLISQGYKPCGNCNP